MKKDKLWGEGQPIEVERLGQCTAYRRIINGEYYQWKIVHGFTSVIGDYSPDNMVALDNAFNELKKKFKSILN